ncbi:hypothetical protein L3Y34_014571 [Caenorhabditis briggsae]|uniref:DUF19 domain-containing protein n=1 Tax=Caenorhabditis briggsae TaxID=6238 RepID=A0AAE9IXP6_CAEBR|nr:hypothetical protein L3Y34_014571 [Caenorhabditis briggsae]
MFVIQIKPVCNYLLYQSGEFFKCILKFPIDEFKLNSSTFYNKHSLENCQLDDIGLQELSDFSRRECGDLAVRNMMEHEEYSCIETIVMPDFLKGLLGIGTMFLKSACDEYGFNVGPFNKCIEKTKFELTTLKNITTADQKPKCELSNGEFSELQKFVQTECGDEAKCIDTMDGPFLLKILAGIANSLQNRNVFSVGPLSKCIKETNFELTTIKNTTTADQKCKLLGDEYSKLSDFVETECGNEAVDNMWKY